MHSAQHKGSRIKHTEQDYADEIISRLLSVSYKKKIYSQPYKLEASVVSTVTVLYSRTKGHPYVKGLCMQERDGHTFGKSCY